MLEALFGNKTKEQVLLFLYIYQEGYAKQIQRILGLPLRSVQLQAKNLEQNGILTAKKQDRAIVYQLNPRHPFYKELTALLEKLLNARPEKIRQEKYTPRLRPRRLGKPL
ncbi:MAG: helix-turn-helix transcriptional regulator [bacterium]|nr:helix-turn-helix transcriptional regulator [bacterium]